MRTLAFWTLGMCAALGLGASGCDGDGSGPGGGGSGAASTTGGSGGTGGSAGGTGGSAGGTGGTIPDAPFTSKGDSSYETQTSLAADGKGGVVVTWLALFSQGPSGIGYAVSRDGGDHWTAPAVIKSPGDRLASNPVVVADSKGTFSLVWLGFGTGANGPDEHIYLSQLDNTTETFGTPVAASDDGTSTQLDFDKPSIKVDAGDELLLTWADFSLTGMGGPASLVFARSADAKTFTTSTITNDATFGNLAALCLDTSLGATAPLYLVHLGANGTVTLRVSANQGQSWELRTTPAEQTLFQDITCAVKGEDLWVVYAAGTAPFVIGEDQPADAVMAMHSADGGQGFDTPVAVSDGAPGERFLYPQLARASSGKLGVVYYQGALGLDGLMMLASSSDGGVTWTNSSIADMGTITVDRTIASWLGGYVGLAVPDNIGLVSFAENSENKAHIKFAQIALP